MLGEQFSHAAPQYGQQQQYGQQPYSAPQYGAPAPYEAPGQPTPGVMTIDDVITKTAITLGALIVAAAITFMFLPPGSPRWSFLRNRGALIFLGVWFATNLVFPFIAGPLGLAEAGSAGRSRGEFVGGRSVRRAEVNEGPRGATGGDCRAVVGPSTAAGCPGPNILENGCGEKR